MQSTRLPRGWKTGLLVAAGLLLAAPAFAASQSGIGTGMSRAAACTSAKTNARQAIDIQTQYRGTVTDVGQCSCEKDEGSSYSEWTCEVTIHYSMD